MHGAADAYIHQRVVYGEPFGLATGYYKYSPFTLLFFIPTVVIPYFYAALIHVVIIGFATFFVFGISSLLFRHQGKTTSFWVFFSAFIIILTHWIREVHLGNINLILVGVLLAGIYLYKNNKWIPASLLIAFAILAKPYFLILAFPFLFLKRFQFVLTVGIAIGICILISLGLLWGNGISLYQDWITAMSEHSHYLTSQQTVFAIFEHITGVHTPNLLTYIILLILAAGSCSIYFVDQFKKIDTEKLLLFHLIVLIAIIPNFLITDTEHFLFSTPLIIFCLIQLRKQKRVIYTVIFIIATIMFGLHSTDLLGKEMAFALINNGVLGIGNLLLIGMAVYLFYKSEKSAV